MDKKTFFGFHFVKVAKISLTETKTDVRYGEQTAFDWDVVVEFIYPGCEQASQSTYLVFVDDELKYAGQYSGVFSDRWLLRRNGLWYLDHSKMDYHIQTLLQSDNPPEVSVWLTLHPYLTSPDGETWNINKALEQKIIYELQPEWNRTGKIAPTQGRPLREILGTHGQS